MNFIEIFLNKEDKQPLYYQLYNYLVQGIQSGSLPAGEKLPGKRTAAGQLGVGVNTVDEAYQMLVAEGYVTARPRSGFVVNQLGQVVAPLPPTAVTEAPAPKKETIWRHSFASGGNDPTLFPRKMWNRLFREVLAEEPRLFEHGEPTGDIGLRTAIAGYLQGYRGVQCQPAQIVVGAGLEVLLGFLARLFAGSAVAVEDPGYPKAAHILANGGLQVVPVPIDEEGMNPEKLAASGATLAYLTPSHQFPTGVVMPVARRTKLLRWAASGQHVLIEDDYDSEYRFDARPLPSLQGLDGEGRVVYAGTFSRSLAPSLRIAYLVLPFWLLAQWQQMYGDYACTVSRPEQHTLARFIQGGHFYRGLNRMRNTYKKRRNLLLAALQTHLQGVEYTTQNTHTGLYFVLYLPGKNAPLIAQKAANASIKVRALNTYQRLQTTYPNTNHALVLGYGGLADEEIDDAAKALCNIIKQG
ncbi:PLP-dependent aminotransferase family protein [Ruminococcaceae bacterium OttesenSCG-928-A16]|nr:PLP-dependent aminotransferase family protein [Ruminococcaceae bacterium OttesenSCG-928-A16]